MFHLVVPAASLVLLCAFAAPAAAQPGSSAAPDAVPQLSARDSARVLSHARTAQARFEQVRRRYLPRTGSRGGGSTCDERVGRFCLWYSDGEDNWKPPPEKPEVTRAREQLIEALDDAAWRVPGDAWVAGQRVRYLLEAERPEDAVAAAHACRAERGWCLALLGYAEHSAGNDVAAGAAFDAALATMPEKERREWTDLRPILDDAGQRAYRQVSAERRDDMEARFWWLADPLWMRPGNDRRNEHFARLVMDQFQERARSTDNTAWGNDLRELLLRYGWPVGWERIEVMVPTLQDEGFVAHYAPNSKSFEPKLRTMDDLSSLPPEEPSLDDDRARSSYQPRYVERFQRLEHQLAVFRRGDTALVVAAYRLGADSLPADSTVVGAVVLASDERTPPFIATASQTGGTGVLLLRAHSGDYVVSVEALGAGWAGRARYGLPVERVGRIAISDPLLLRSAEPQPGSLEDALPLARSSTNVHAGEPVAIYWEAYGLEPDTAEPVSLALSLTKNSRGWFARATTKLGLTGEPEPVRIQWTEPPVGGGTLARTVTLTLPERLAAGNYALELTLTAPGQEPVSSARTLRVEK